MKDLFLLGAGASKEAGIPIATDMTKRMLDIFSGDKYLEKHSRILRFVVGGLLFKQGVKGQDPFNGVDIEALFNAVRLLADRKNSEISSFVSSWSPIIDEMEGGEIDEVTAKHLLDTIYEPIERYLEEHDRYHQEKERHIHSLGKRIDPWLSQYEFKETLKFSISEFMRGSGGKLFEETAEIMTRKLIEIVWINDPSRIQKLIPLVKYAQENGSSIVTLNYDNTIELSSEIARIQIDTGFESWSRTGVFSFRPHHVPFIKLHGSIDWALLEERPTREKPLIHEIIRKVVPTEISEKEKNFRPEIIFGGKNKLTAKGPFLGLLQAFETKLAQCDRLIVVGYSFRDDHVNEYIRTWMNGNLSRVLLIINPFIKTLDNSFVDELLKLEKIGRVIPMDKTATEGIEEIIADGQLAPRS